jgi:hypothetical protein
VDQTSIIFLAVAAVCLAVVGFALRTGRILGIAFRSRFIARREHEPALFWISLAIFAAFGAFLLYAVISVRFF